MTDRSEPLTPEEEAAVARMLAEAGGPEPMPADVAARLSGLVDELVADRAAETDSSDVADAREVVELASRRRRWPKVLLAAAAVVVGGYAVGNVVDEGSFSASEDSSAAGAADSAEVDRDGAQESAPEEAPRASGAEALVRQALPVRLSSERLDAGVRRALGVLAVTALGEGADTSTAPDRAQLDTAFKRSCEQPTLGDDEQSLPVLYDGRPAVLVSRPAGDGLVEVTVYACSGAELDTTTLAP